MTIEIKELREHEEKPEKTLVKELKRKQKCKNKKLRNVV